MLIVNTACSRTISAENKTIAPLPAGVTPTSENNYPGMIMIGGLQRSYLVHLPSGYDKNRHWPLVMALHGGGGEGRTMNALTNFNSLADEQGFVVVYPDGYGRNWNDGRGDPGVKAQAENIDDVGFISVLIDHLGQELNINKKMIYVTGISNGAMMTYRLGAQLTDKIAAIAAVAGNIPEKTVSVWSPSRPVSVLIINGTEDPLVPFQGGDVSFLSLKRGKVVSASDSVKFWVSKDACASAPQTRNLPHLNPADATSTVVEDYSGCRDGTEVILYTVKGGGHTWPGGLQYMQERLIGRTSRDFSATDTIWQFFKGHPMR